MASANEKKRGRPFSSPGMASSLEYLTTLMSRFPEVDCTKLHSRYACRSCSDCLQTRTNNLQSALPSFSSPARIAVINVHEYY